MSKSGHVHDFRATLIGFGKACVAVVGWLASALKAILSRTRRVLLTARAWVLFALCVIAVLVAYYILSDQYTPFTTDAYVQAYVVQVAPRVEGQVVHVFVEENQPVKKDDLLFEIDPRPFQYQIALLEAKRVEAVQQVAQLESDLAAAKADDERLVAEEDYARVVNDQEQEIYKREATTDRLYVQAVRKLQGGARGSCSIAGRNPQGRAGVGRAASVKNMPWSRK